MKTSYPPYVVNTSINIRKNKFIAYIYTCHSQNLDEISYISAKTESVKHLQAVLVNNGTASKTTYVAEVKSDRRQPWFIMAKLWPNFYNKGIVIQTSESFF